MDKLVDQDGTEGLSQKPSETDSKSNDYLFIRELGSEGNGDGQFSNPGGIAVDPYEKGSVYVADSDNDRIQKFDSNGNFITKWGSYGSGDGQFNYPIGISY